MIRNRFHGFLAASLLLHAGVFLAWPGVSQHEIAVIPAATPLQLALSPASELPAVDDVGPPVEQISEIGEAEAVTDAASASDDSMTEQSVPKTVPAPAQAPAPLPEPTAGHSSEPPAMAATKLAAPATLSNAEIRDRLHEAVETHFHYPPLARRRGWEGEVMVGVRVEGDGRLSAVDVVSSSGYRVLDRAAVDSLKRMARLQDSGRLPPGGVEFEIPVRYVLLDRPA